MQSMSVNPRYLYVKMYLCLMVVMMLPGLTVISINAQVPGEVL